MEEINMPGKDELDELMFYKSNLMRAKLSKLGLYVGQPLILNIVVFNPGLTQKNLANIGRIKPSTVNVMLNRMAKNGLIEIKKDENNAKFSKVYATKKGKQLSEKCVEFKTNLQNIIYENITEEEKNEFKNILLKINNNLKNELKKGGLMQDENV